MFEVGDKIVCIDDSDTSGHLRLYGVYTIDVFTPKMKNIITLKGREFEFYNINRFVSLSEYRKIKLKKICLKLEIK